MQLAERVREAVAAADWPGEATVTVSLGCAAYASGEGQYGFLARVDDALYAAKGAGRNCVRLADDA